MICDDGILPTDGSSFAVAFATRAKLLNQWGIQVALRCGLWFLESRLGPCVPHSPSVHLRAVMEPFYSGAWWSSIVLHCRHVVVDLDVSPFV